MNNLNNDRINVALGDRSYTIRIAESFEPLAELDGSGRKALLVSDSNVAPLYGGACADVLQKAGFIVTSVTVKAGENSKTLREAECLYTAAAAAGLDRSSFIIALGGGMIGDLAGFVAATYLRGLSLIQVPASLLAMVDSSVGGKTAVNLDAGKNLVGCFHQPVSVAINLDVLHTLPEREYRSGLAEIVKYGLICDASLYQRLSKATALLLNRDPPFLARTIARCCQLKSEIVALDERESGPRALLNFGHTFGHAIEAWSGYGKLFHGEAVAIGMVFAAYLSQRRGGLAAADVTALENTLGKLGLPVRLPAKTSDWRDIHLRMLKDKKTVDDRLQFVLLKSAGCAEAKCSVSEKDIKEVWNVIRH